MTGKRTGPYQIERKTEYQFLSTNGGERTISCSRAFLQRWPRVPDAIVNWRDENEGFTEQKRPIQAVMKSKHKDNHTLQAYSISGGG